MGDNRHLKHLVVVVVGSVQRLSTLLYYYNSTIATLTSTQNV